MATRKAEVGKAHFTKDVFKFLQELKANNNRDWFLANKERYETNVKGSFLQFIADFSSYLEKVNRNFVADPRPNGGSMMRIYRDIRFSKDKTPYKTWLAAHFPHKAASTDCQAPSFYLHMDLDHCFAAGGMWHPDKVALKKVRDSIVNRPKSWRKVVDSGIPIEGETGSRPPKGYSADHQFIEDLKRKDFCASIRFKQSDVVKPDFIQKYAEACKSMIPLMKFLTEAVGLEW
ncbi:MAG: DUF2461 domain-containing protein [Blastocatellia bacterium]